MYNEAMTDDKRFAKVEYSEFEPDSEEQKVIDEYVGTEKPWLLISADSVDGVLSFNVEAGGGLPLELVEPMMEKALLAFRQGQEQA